MFERSGIKFAYEPSVVFKRDAQWRFGREPLPRRMPDGSLVCLVYSGGDKEPSPDNVELIVRSRDDGAAWSAPEVLFSHKSRAVWATELFTDCATPFAVVHTFEYEGFYSELRAHLSFTKDSGATWSEPVTLKGVPPNFSVRQGRVLSDGAWIFPVYWLESYGYFDWANAMDRKGSKWHFACGVIRSTNNGESFSLHGYLPSESPRYGSWEPDLIELEPGHLLMLVRYGDGVLARSESFDFGISWTPLRKSDIPNPASKIVMRKVEGQVVLLHNPTAERRTRVEAWTSADNCKTWGRKTLLAELAPDAAPGKMICYPHAFNDDAKRLLYVALDSVGEHNLVKVPYDDLLI